MYFIGWVSILHTWANGRDMELSLKAAKALANLDEDFGGAKKYPEGVYLYYPKARFRYSATVTYAGG